jgi:hypothetical protein
MPGSSRTRVRVEAFRCSTTPVAGEAVARTARDLVPAQAQRTMSHCTIDRCALRDCSSSFVTLSTN